MNFFKKEKDSVGLTCARTTAGVPPSSRRQPPAASVWLPLHLAAHEGRGGTPPARREVGQGGAPPSPTRGKGGEGAAGLCEEVEDGLRLR
jgi:hypothetical protein